LYDISILEYLSLCSRLQVNANNISILRKRMNHDLVYIIKLQAHMFTGTHVLLDESPN